MDGTCDPYPRWWAHQNFVVLVGPSKMNGHDAVLWVAPSLIYDSYSISDGILWNLLLRLKQIYNGFVPHDITKIYNLVKLPRRFPGYIFEYFHFHRPNENDFWTNSDDDVIGTKDRLLIPGLGPLSCFVACIIFIGRT